jgi:hypothetical protein
VSCVLALLKHAAFFTGFVSWPPYNETTTPLRSYKMPPIQIKIESSGNGIKTVLPNLSAVAKALHTQTSYLIKYFGMPAYLRAARPPSPLSVRDVLLAFFPFFPPLPT